MKLKFFNKKADLSLSINTIVILILAITMLGLGLAFLNGTFTKTTAQFSQVADVVKNQITSQITSSNGKVILNTQEVDLKTSEEKDVYYGIRNVLGNSSNNGNFIINSFCSQALNHPNYGAKDIAGSVVLATFTTWPVQPGDVGVLKMQVTATSSAVFDNYACEIDVCSADSTVTTPCTSGSSNLYGQAKFFVVVGATD